MTRSSPLVEAILQRQPLHVIQQIVHADPDSVRHSVDDNDNWYPLHEAVVSGASVYVIRFLAEPYPQALRMKDKLGWLPLHFAAQRDTANSPEVIRCLCRGWPDALHELTNGGWDPAHIASHVENWEGVLALAQARYGGFGVGHGRARAPSGEAWLHLDHVTQRNAGVRRVASRNFDGPQPPSPN